MTIIIIEDILGRVWYIPTPPVGQICTLGLPHCGIVGGSLSCTITIMSCKLTCQAGLPVCMYVCSSHIPNPSRLSLIWKPQCGSEICLHPLRTVCMPAPLIQQLTMLLQVPCLAMHAPFTSWEESKGSIMVYPIVQIHPWNEALPKSKGWTD